VPRGIQKLKQEIVKIIDPAGVGAFSQEGSFPASSFGQGNIRMIELGPDPPAAGDSGFYIQEGRTVVGSKDVIKPGSYFER